MRILFALGLCCVASVAVAQPNVVAQAGNENYCYWAGVPYSTGARLSTSDLERDPHVMGRFFVCHNGAWTQQ